MLKRIADLMQRTPQDRFKRYLVFSLLIVGVVLVITSRQHPPVIEALEVTSERHEHCYLIQDGALEYRVGREQLYDIVCTVSNVRGTLIYEWTCDSGEMEGEGSIVTWTAPKSSSDVTVKVTARNATGDEVSESVLLRVVSCSPCTFRGCP